jgi:hypothetical protein
MINMSYISLETAADWSRIDSTSALLFFVARTKDSRRVGSRHPGFFRIIVMNYESYL